jgi:hypothetical protein
LQLLSLASPHHPDCPLPAPALISPGPLYSAPRPLSLLPFPHHVPAWAWGTSGAPLPPKPLPYGVWDEQNSL